MIISDQTYCFVCKLVICYSFSKRI